MKIKKRFLLFAVLLLSLFPLFCSAETIGVGVYIFGMDYYDISTGEYSIDLVITLKCENCSIGDFEIINGRIESYELNYQKPGEKQYRVYASLTNIIDLKKFPFDTQKIIITLQHKYKTEDKLILEAIDYGTGIDHRLKFPGWKVQDWEVEVVQRDYPVFNRIYSTYTFGFELKREAVDSLIKLFFPLIFLIIIIISTYILNTDKIELRLGVISSVLITLVIFHIMLLEPLPSTSYFTFADQFMLLTYLVLLVTFVINVVILRLSQVHKKKIVENIHKKTRYGMMILIPLIYILFFLFFL
jgi:hypothetical protein